MLKKREQEAMSDSAWRHCQPGRFFPSAEEARPIDVVDMGKDAIEGEEAKLTKKLTGSKLMGYIKGARLEGMGRNRARIS